MTVAGSSVFGRLGVGLIRASFRGRAAVTPCVPIRESLASPDFLKEPSSGGAGVAFSSELISD